MREKWERKYLDSATRACAEDWISETQGFELREGGVVLLLNLLIKTKLCRMRLEKTSVISAGWLTVIAPPSPSPRLPAHCFQCKCSPFVSVDQMSRRLLCWSASLLIRSEQRVQSPTSPFPLFTQTAGAHEHGKIHQSIRLSSQAPGISLLSFTVMWHNWPSADLLHSFHVRKCDLHKVMLNP